MSDLVADAVDVLRPAEQILVFSGAGLSTESGIPDFRGPDGLWTKVDPDDFTIERYRHKRDLRVQGWKMHIAGELWGARSTVQPNKGHMAIKALRDRGRLAGVVTQNIDGLHHQSGLEDDFVAELHGNVRNAHCMSCDGTWPTESVLEWVEAGEEDPACPRCGGLVKTDTIMYGEVLPDEEVRKAGIFLAIAEAVLVVGSTVSVWPAADFVIRAANQAKPIVVINRGPTEVDHIAAVKIDAGIGDTLPGLVEALLT
ncbi:MAG: Sir2 family NAD-dependent protein deacetylase [Actinomycetota bacterium]|nr:Sir2 family NAD-dependent protein deacetylase [Actinomycetota bacterium]